MVLKTTNSYRIRVFLRPQISFGALPSIFLGRTIFSGQRHTPIIFRTGPPPGGAQLGSRSTQGQWSASQRSWQFNVLEMQAVINAVRDFLSHLRSRVVRLMGKNVVTVAYIKNEGGTRSYTLMRMTIRLLKWCDGKAITLVPVHLPGVHNIQAVFLSRVGQTLNTEWTMAMERLRPVFVQWGELQVDLFATFANRRLIKLHRRIRTPGPSSWTPCRCPGTTGGASCLLYRHSRWSLKYCRRNIRTPGLSSWTSCRCPGTTGGASCLVYHHSRWSLKYCRRNIRTPGLSSWTSCRCPGTTGGASCLLYRHSRWSLKYCRRLLSHQESR